MYIISVMKDNAVSLDSLIFLRDTCLHQYGVRCNAATYF